jgi:hypothetical protein
VQPGAWSDQKTKKVGKFVNKKITSDLFEETKKPQDEDDFVVANPNDINLSINNSSYGGVLRHKVGMYESSHDDNSSGSGNHSQSQQLINFKKQISTKEMPQSIIKLNRLVLGLVMVILAVVVFDTVQNYQYYSFS